MFTLCIVIAVFVFGAIAAALHQPDVDIGMYANFSSVILATISRETATDREVGCTDGRL